LGENLTGPAATGGFAAAGAVLLALAVIASEEIAVLPFLHGSHAARLLEQQSPAEAGDPNAPFNSLARAAIGAAHQGVFDLDFRAGLLTLSVEAAQMVGLSAIGWPMFIPTTARSTATHWTNTASAPAWRSGWNFAPGVRAVPIAGWSCAPPSSANRMFRPIASA
jgi:hypothetical protein